MERWTVPFEHMDQSNSISVRAINPELDGFLSTKFNLVIRLCNVFLKSRSFLRLVDDDKHLGIEAKPFQSYNMIWVLGTHDATDEKKQPYWSEGKKQRNNVVVERTEVLFFDAVCVCGKETTAVPQTGFGEWPSNPFTSSTSDTHVHIRASAHTEGQTSPWWNIERPW